MTSERKVIGAVLKVGNSILGSTILGLDIIRVLYGATEMRKEELTQAHKTTMNFSNTLVANICKTQININN